jgi:hypothetical protein
MVTSCSRVRTGCYAAGVAKSAGITSGTEAAGPILCLKMLFCFAPCAYADLRNEIVDKLGMDQGEKITCCQAQPCCAGGACCACGPTMFLSCNLVALKKTITKAQNAAGGAPAMCIDDRGTEEAAAEEVTSQPGAAE